MRRREFIGVVGGTAAWPLVARAQQASIPVVGYLATGPANPNTRFETAFRKGLSSTGYTDGKNVAIEYRWAEGQYARLPKLATDLVERGVAVIHAGGLVSALAAKAASSTTPIVFNVGADPVKAGLVASFNRPGGNLTGVAGLIEALGPKRLGLLNELLPKVPVIGVLANASNPTAQTQVEEIKAAAQTIARQLYVVSVRDKNDLDTDFTILAQDGVGALLVVPDPVLIENRAQIVALAARHAIPAIYPVRDFADAGGLVSYGTDLADAMRQGGVYTGEILRGAKPSDLPVVQSVKLELIINLKTAKALGLEIPPQLLARADEVIE
jgi:putative tryptophan/tyrosine transport system substrate-binding protein